MPGHLFIVQGDLTRIACDAWLLPTGRSLQIRSHWLRGAPAELLRLVTGSGDARENVPEARSIWVFRDFVKTPPGWSDRSTRSFDLTEWKTSGHRNRPWPTQIVVDLTWSVEKQARWIAAGARQFVERAAASLVNSNPAYGRAKHLLALPVVGTGYGGGWAAAGAILRELIAELSEAVSRIDADVVLVTFTPDQFAAAQHARQQLTVSGRIASPWSSIPAHLIDVGRVLAERSTRGELVLFLGAGVSMSAGLPSWSGLLDHLAAEAGFDDEARRALKELPAVDQARLVRDRMERPVPDGSARQSMAAAICAQVTADRYGLSHALLANLPVAEVVTTNYDTLFEQASNDADQSTAILPYEPIEGKDLLRNKRLIRM